MRDRSRRGLRGHGHALG